MAIEPQLTTNKRLATNTEAEEEKWKEKQRKHANRPK